MRRHAPLRATRGALSAGKKRAHSVATNIQKGRPYRRSLVELRWSRPNGMLSASPEYSFAAAAVVPSTGSLPSLKGSSDVATF